MRNKKGLLFNILIPATLVFVFMNFNPEFSRAQNVPVLDWKYQTKGNGSPGLGHGIQDMVIDKDDFIYKSGSRPPNSDPIDLDPDPNNQYLIEPIPGSNIGIGYIAKYSPNGELLKVIELELSPQLIRVDDNGNIYTSGEITQPTDFDPSSNTFILEPDARELYLAKYDSQGNFLWAKSTETQGWSQVFTRDMAMSIENNRLTVSGIFTGDVDMNPDENESFLFSSIYPEAHAFVTTYDLEGEFIWATDFNVQNVTSDSREYYVTYDNNGNLFLSGQFQDTLQLDQDNIIPPLIPFSNEFDEHDIFLAKYNLNAELDWITAMQGESRNNCRDIKAYGDYVLVTGHTNKDMTVYSADRNDSVYFDYKSRPRPYIVKFSGNDGSINWAFNLSPEELTSGGAYYLSTDQNDNCYIAGRLNGSEPMDFNPDPNNEHLITNNSGNQECFLAKYTSDGDFAWAFSTPGGFFTEPKGLQVLSDNRVVLAGSFKGNVDVSGYGNGDSLLVTTSSQKVFMAIYQQAMLSTNAFSENDGEVSLYPNPASDKQTVQLSGYEGKNVKITLYDIQGRKIRTVFDKKIFDKKHNTELNISDLNNGIYLYDLRTGNNRYTLRFLKN